MRGDTLPDPPPPDRRAQAAWMSYDWANSAFPTVVVTFIFPAYYAKAIASDDVGGSSEWAFAISLSMLVVAVISPFLGAAADALGRIKPWVLVFTVVTVAGTAALWFTGPGSASAVWFLVAVGIANIGFESGTVFYNALLPRIAPPALLGRISGWAWALGYAGGLICLALALVLLVRPDPPLFPLDRATAEHVRATALLVAAWIALFSVPFFLLTPDRPVSAMPLGLALRQGARTVVATVRQLPRHRNVAIYLLGHMIYTDGLNTLFSIGGLYAAVTLGLGFDDVLLFGIAMNISAGIGAFAFAWIDDWLGSRSTILLALVGMTVLGTAVLLAATPFWFWCFALPLGLFFGPTQAASRSLMARLAPPHLTAEFFGLYALSGKATAFLGPAVFGAVTAATGSQRWGLATIVAFFIVGGGLLWTVKEPARSPQRISGARLNGGSGGAR